MSKYRIQVIPSKFKLLFEQGLYVLLIVSLWHWQPFLFSFQEIVQWALSFALICYILFRFYFHKEHSLLWEVSEHGDCTFISDSTYSTLSEPLHITPKSRVAIGVLFVHFQSVFSGKSWWVGITRDQVGDQNFRRLSRIILGQQYALSTTEEH